MRFHYTFPFVLTISVVFLTLILSGCASRSTISKKPAKKMPVVKHPVKKTLPRKGHVLVLEYHKVVKKEARWDRSIDRFCKDLHLLYDQGFRPITMSEYISGNFDSYSVVQKGNWWEPPVMHFLERPAIKGIPPGTKPVVITFDDSHPSQLRLLADGSVDPDCAVGIWERFAAKHPDFPVKATFYVLPEMMWGQKKWRHQKLRILKDWGCELGSHTMNHSNLQHLSNEQVKKEFAHSIRFIEKLGFTANTIALPYGVAPRNRYLLRGFKLDGKWYGFKAAVLGGAGPAPLPSSKRFEPFRIPRVQGINGFLGINYWLRKVKYGKLRIYTTSKTRPL
jgi:hypothetical protein